MKNPLSILTLLVLGGLAHGSTVLSDSFDSYSPGSLAGQGGWTRITSGGTTNPIQVSTDPDDDSNQLAALGGTDYDDPSFSGDDLFRAFGSTVAYVTGGSIEMDFTLLVDQVQTGAIFAGFGPTATAANNTIYGCIFVQDDGSGGYYLGLAAVGANTTATTATYGTDSLDPYTDYAISLVWNFAGGQNKDTFQLFVDGDLYQDYTWSQSGSTPSQLASMILRQGGASAAPVLTIDDLSVLSPQELVIPEPAAITLLASGAAGLFLLRRHRPAMPAA